MTERDRAKLLYVALGLASGWLIGGIANIGWFFYSVQVLGYGEHAPGWYISIRDMLRPAVLLLSMTAGYVIAQRNFRLACSEDGHKGTER